MRKRSLGALAALCVASVAHGQTVPFHYLPEVPEAFRLVALPTDAPVPVLINGTPVSPGAWKQTVRINTNGAGCTASIVGPRVLATAAHCAATGATSRFTLDGVSYTAKITRHPSYPRTDVDVALGVIDKEITGIEYGVIPGRADVAKKDMPIRLMGYGCIDWANGNGAGGNDGILREGTSTITGFSGNDISTGPLASGGNSALCFGDSGGPAWLEVQEGTALVRYNITQNSKSNGRNSWLARWDTATSQSFLRSWISSNNNLEICGVNKTCGGTGPTPSPTPTPPGPTPTPTPPGPTPTPPNGKTFVVEGESVAVQGTVKDSTLDPEYVKKLFQNLIDFLDE